jgi:hypothetical protein
MNGFGVDLWFKLKVRVARGDIFNKPLPCLVISDISAGVR